MLVGAFSSLVGMIRVHRTPRGFCQHQQYATAWWTNAYKSGPVGTEVLAILNTNKNAWHLWRDVSLSTVKFFYGNLSISLYFEYHICISVRCVEGDQLKVASKLIKIYHLYQEYYKDFFKNIILNSSKNHERYYGGMLRVYDNSLFSWQW